MASSEQQSKAADLLRAKNEALLGSGTKSGVLSGTVDKNAKAGNVPSRRKIIDRRDPDSESAPPENSDERRDGVEDRRGMLIDAPSKSAKQKGEQEKAIELVRKRNELKVQQHRKKILLAGCEPVMGLNYDCLALDDYPEHALVAAAKRDRDALVFVSTISTSVFLFGMAGATPALVAGIAAGISVVSLLLAFTSLRKLFSNTPLLHELLEKRKKMEFVALNHIFFLEGADGLAWRCAKMYKYNHNLSRNMFDGVVRFSREMGLKEVLKSRKHIRLYLLFMVEAQKAYKKLQKDYLSQHFDHMEQGWDDSITDAEAEKIEKELERNEKESES